MWSARGAYRNAEGRIVPLPERSPLWTDKDGLLSQIRRDHRLVIRVPPQSFREDWYRTGDWYRWVDEAGVERFVIIEEHE